MTAALDTLRGTAQAGDNAVRLQLADRLLDERQPQNFVPFEALYWVEQAGLGGKAQALIRAGTMWGTGLGFAARPEIARARFEAAAHQDTAEAQFALAYCLENGIGGARDPRYAPD